MQLVLLVGAIIVAWLVFSWLINVIKVSFKTALMIAVIILILQFAFGISPQQLGEEIWQLPQRIQSLFKH